MSAASGLAKGWCLTIASGALGYALAKNADAVAWIGILAVVLFGMLDARYLREERKFRALYDQARKGERDVYDLNATCYGKKGDESFHASCSWPEVLKSWSLWAFYVPILVIGGTILIGQLGPNSDSGAGNRGSHPKHCSSDSRSSASPAARFVPMHHRSV